MGEDSPKKVFKKQSNKDVILIVGDFAAVEQRFMQALDNACVQAGFPTERIHDKTSGRTGIRGGAGTTTGRFSGRHHNQTNRPNSGDIPALIGPDDHALFETVLRIMVGLQTGWTATLLEVSTDGRQCKVQGEGWTGWVMSQAVLQLELPC
jgi:hypothetical protein